MRVKPTISRRWRRLDASTFCRPKVDRHELVSDLLVSVTLLRAEPRLALAISRIIKHEAPLEPRG